MSKNRLFYLVLVTLALVLGVLNIVQNINSNKQISDLKESLAAEVKARKDVPEEFDDMESVDDDGYQAVFMDNGQTYFGHIQNFDASHVILNDIYYLRTNAANDALQTSAGSAQSDVSLAKLGCELHGPKDTMYISRSKVLFWENLKADSQISTAIKAYVRANPNGQKCPA